MAALGAELWMLSGNNTAAMTASNSALQLAISPADKANALRSRAAAGLAQGGSTMDVAIGDAEQALAIDQLLGASARVIADLDLLETAYNRKGNTQQANRYAAMRQAAQTARDQLRLK